MAKKKKGDDRDVSESFKWTDDEAKLLLKVTHEYKVLKSVEDVDWESVQSKCSDILKRMLVQLPASSEEAKELNKEENRYYKASINHQVESY